ncbi:MAG: glucose-1-phosphate thymidylyltransferase, partial [Flavobacteriaceae bacterium]|nr:glucose-1-phosphate thymidylyltransferase [Flavobacteriaceae bacterium]
MSTQINAILFDGPERVQLLPFTYIRPVAQLRIGIDTLIEKWNAFLNTSCSYATQAYLAPKFPAKPAALNCFINPSYIPTQALVDQIKELQEKQVLLCENKPVAYCTSDSVLPQDFSNFEVVVVQEVLLHIEKVSDLFSKNAAVLAMDFDRLTHNKVSQPLDNSNRLIHPERIFIAPGAQVSCAVLNATDGPIYIGSDAQIM